MSQLVTVNNSIPSEVSAILKPNGVPMKATQFLAAKGGVKLVKGMKLKELKELVGKDKAKTILAEFNANKGAFHVWSSKVAALAVNDPSQRKETRVVINDKGVMLGTNIKTRFVKDATTTAAVTALNAANAKIAELEARFAALTAPAVS